MTKQLSLKIGGLVSTNPSSTTVVRGELAGAQVSVKYYGKLQLTQQITSVRVVADIDPLTKVYFDERADALCVISRSSAIEPIQLRAVDAVRCTKEVLARLNELAKDSTDDVSAAGMILYESLTGSAYQPPAHRAINSVYARVVENMVSRRYDCERALTVLDQLRVIGSDIGPPPGDQVLVADPVPDPADVDRRVALCDAFAPIIGGMVSRVSIAEPAREVAEAWFTDSRQILEEIAALGSDEVNEVIAGELEQLARHLERAALDDREFVEERSRIVAHALVGNWTATLAEIVGADLEILDATLWPAEVGEPHRSEYAQLAAQLGYGEGELRACWRELGNAIVRADAPVELPNGLRLVRIDADAVALLGPSSAKREA